MPEDKSVSPEQELLRLIEASKGPSTNTNAKVDNNTNAKRIQTNAIKHSSLSLLSYPAWLGRISFFKDRFKSLPNLGRFYQPDIKLVNNLLSLSILILGFYFVNSFYASLNNLKKMPDLEFKASNQVKALGSEGVSVLKKATSYYLEKVTARDIFKRGAKKRVANSANQGPSEEAIKATQGFKLVGISWSDNPDAMVEDTKALKTFFVKRGQMIGEVKVEAIFKDKVVLSFDGEEIEIK